MPTWKDEDDSRYYDVVHPLDDVPEQKLAPTETMGRMRMTPAVKFSLMALRIYLFLMIGLVFYRVLDLAGVFGHHK